MALPFQQKHVKEGIELFEKKKVGQILFSGGTYQVEVLDYWPFLQMDDKGKILDCFCGCGKEEVVHSCPHLVCAYLAIFQGTNTPLHIRFQNSLWSRLCQMASLRHGYDPSVLKDKYFAASETGKQLFYVHGLTEKGKKKLREIIEEREVETEETSLKFSNLPIEEIALWKAGRPSHYLKFELSFWSDLAKWWMSLHQYTITYSEEELPKWIYIKFRDVEVGFYIAEANWPQIIPAIATVKSPLKVFELPDGTIKKITYDGASKQLHIDATIFKSKVEGKTVGDWVYVPSIGFYPSIADRLLQQKIIEENKISLFFNRHLSILEKHLEGTTIHKEAVAPQHKLFFDDEGNLHIQSYVFEEGDLKNYFPPWAFIEGKGFFRLEKLYFETPEKIIPKQLLGEFISRHRLWLQTFEGFQTHLTGIETRLTYTVKNGSLQFESEVEEEAVEELVDLGGWIYIKGKGFYAKKGVRMGSILKPGIVIPKDKVSSFIHVHREELEQVNGFFANRTFLEKLGLTVFLNEEQKIVVRPEYFFYPSYTKEKVQFFDYFLYVEGEGFSEISPEFLLPKEYTREKTISVYEEPYFISYELDLLSPHILSLDKRLTKPKNIVLKAEQVRKEGKGWLADLVYETEMGVVNAYDLWEAKNYLFSDAGLIFLKTERFNWLKNITKRKWIKKKSLLLSTMEWLRLFVFEDMKVGDDPETNQILFELRNFQTEEPLNLEGLKSHLRPYQEFGVRWLWFIYTQSLSGLLCDEMGLGKTHQAMALLAAASNASKNQKYLVVCPTSVIYHWEDLLKQFLPELKVCVFYGALRTLETDYDLLLTSYGTLRSEKEVISHLHFTIAIFDELQVAKNNHSQIHKALSSLDADVRIGLTGTPIENHIVELKALFDLVLPGYFPQDSLFRELFVNPIEKYQDKEKKEFLNRLIKPFMLRRRKKDVLLELPEKIEEISSCPLSEEQKGLYKEIYGNYKKLEEGRFEFGHIFSLISKLKQLCDHPSLILGDITEYKKHSSGKWDLFVELLDEVRESGQKLVVFSQYLGMLDIIEMHLKEKNIGFAGIRGNTQNRKLQLENFKNDPKCEVFVASLQAAGVGIELTSASVVIHYDRWWNPARENQATDRVHRMGQSRGVQVFKLVTKNSIEEHIHNLIEKKAHLMESIVGFDEHDQVKSLNKQELLELMSLLEKDI